MKTLFAVILLIFVTGCSHPLEIVGHGDIISSSGEHDCLLEDNPCTNYVIGDYDVTYTAMPRAGWSFSEWEGCGEQWPDCSFQRAKQHRRFIVGTNCSCIDRCFHTKRSPRHA